MSEKSSGKKKQVIMLGLDAAEFELIDKYVAKGIMPNLAALRARGFSARLRTKPDEFLSIVWTTAFTSNSLGTHGWYFNKQWNSKKQHIQITSPEWMPRRPFWNDLDDDCKVLLFDVPYAVDLPKSSNQMAIQGWQNHDDFGKSSKPAHLRRDLEKKFGRSAMRPEIFGPQTKNTLLCVRQETLDVNNQFGDIIADFAANQGRDLIFAVLGSVHRGSHYFWDLSQIDQQRCSAEELALISSALEDSYKSTDDMIGKITRSAPEDAIILVFALHGMGPNLGWHEYLPRIVERVHSGATGEAVKKGLLYRFKKAVPWQLVRQITRRLPNRLNEALIPLWSKRMYDWNKTRYFALPMDYNGYIRMNIVGREIEGCLRPEDLDAEIQNIEQALMSFRDIKTGKQIISGVTRVEELMDDPIPARENIPDLVVSWAADFPTSESCGVVSDEFGEIRWPEGQKLPSGRSGNHTPNGWFVAAGADIQQGISEKVFNTTDIVPTVVHWLGANENEQYEGVAIEELRIN